ncbi:MAG: hypothetical protein BRD46_04530 [Bacteroidetes bacterium QS_8_68_15]|nr:MAG: hypothetical protein BRD46_04530 [Bacteroidetes bacterium QS_8_68_15]
MIDALVSNAVASTEEGAITVSAGVEGDSENDPLYLRVEDDSSSVSKSLLNSIFSIGSSPEQDDEDAAHEQHMAFVHRLSGLLQGTVEMESQRDEGTVFTVTLSRVLAPDLAEDVAPPARPDDEAPADEAPAGEEVADEEPFAVDSELAPPVENTSEVDDEAAGGEFGDPFDDLDFEELGDAGPSAAEAPAASPAEAEEDDAESGAVEAPVEDVISRGFPDLETIERSDTDFDEPLAAVRERLSADPPELRPAVLDVTDYLRRALDGLEPAARNKGLTMHRALPDRSVSIEADPGAFRLLVAALVNNAISSTEEGSITVGGRAESDGDDVRLRVVDTGADISKTLLDSLLDVESADEEEENSGAGTHGQHMAFVHRLSSLMQGSVEMESERGKGTVFSVRLPRWPDHDLDVAAPDAEEDETAESGEEETLPPDEPAAGGDGADPSEAAEDWGDWGAPGGEPAPYSEEEAAPPSEPEPAPEPAPPSAADEEEDPSDFWDDDSIFSTSPDPAGDEDPDGEDDPDAFRSDPDSPFSF